MFRALKILRRSYRELILVWDNTRICILQWTTIPLDRSGSGQVYEVKKVLPSRVIIPNAAFERLSAESITWISARRRGQDTFEEDASKESSSPILERETRILEKGRREEEGIEASKRVVGDEGTILHVVLTLGSSARQFPKEEIFINQKKVSKRDYISGTSYWSATAMHYI
jgi:hypothetical protein